MVPSHHITALFLFRCLEEVTLQAQLVETVHTYAWKLPAYMEAIKRTLHYHTSSYSRSGERRSVLPLSHYSTLRITNGHHI